MRYLVTGGAGFIGSSIVESLLERGESVRVVDNFSTGKRENIEPFLNRVEFIEGDLCDIEVAKKAVKDMDYVLHQAAIPSVPRSIEDPLKTNESNITATLNLLLVSLEAKVKRFVYASSSSVYGNSPSLPKREDMPPEPESPYAVSKLTGEYYTRLFFKLYGLETVALRYFNVFGPRQDPTSQYAAVVPKFITALLNNDPPLIYGDGEQTRDFTYIENVVEANILAATTPKIAGRVFNIATSEGITVNRLFQTLREIVGVRIEPVYTKPRKGDVKHSFADIGEAKRYLNYKPTVGFEEGLERTVEWFKKNG